MIEKTYLLNMDNDSICTVMELFMSNDAFNRPNLDIGQLFESDMVSTTWEINK